jgi:hypothetical protein
MSLRSVIVVACSAVAPAAAQSPGEAVQIDAVQVRFFLRGRQFSIRSR